MEDKGRPVNEEGEKEVDAVVLNAQYTDEDSLLVPEGSPPRDSGRVAELERELEETREELRERTASAKAREVAL